MGSLFSSPEPEPEQIGFGVMLTYLWLFIIFIKYITRIKTEDVVVAKTNNLTTIIGLQSVKDEIMYYMDFINNPEKYKSWDVKLPKGKELVKHF